MAEPNVAHGIRGWLLVLAVSLTLSMVVHLLALAVVLWTRGLGATPETIGGFVMVLALFTLLVLLHEHHRCFRERRLRSSGRSSRRRSSRHSASAWTPATSWPLWFKRPSGFRTCIAPNGSRRRSPE